MSRSKRIVAPEEGHQYHLSGEEESMSCDEGDVLDSTPFIPYLSHVTDGCSIRELDPTCFIALHLSLAHACNAVKRIKPILNGTALSHTRGIGLTGMISGPPTSIVVPLVGDLEALLISYLEKKYEDEEDRKAAMQFHETWYGIIDGYIVHVAIIELQV